jgi:isopentenyl-diphosphate delta-isomerase
MTEAEVILVNEKDEPVGVIEKMEAHRRGLLHRAFSVFLFNKKGEMLLQQRALTKYHSAGLWSNACCSHPKPGEELIAAVNRRLKEEMGIVAPVKKIFDFVYRSEFEHGMLEYEFDHVFIGEYDGEINFDPSEVKQYTYKTMEEIEDSLNFHSQQQYTSWFNIAFPRIKDWWISERRNKQILTKRK